MADQPVTEAVTAKRPTVAVAVSGYRLGHVMRTSRIVDELLMLGCRPIVITGGTPAAYLRATHPNLEVRDIGYLRYEQHARGIAYTRTAFTNFATLLSAPRSVARIEGILRDENVALALVDFEPFVPRAARSLGIPIVNLNHQNILHGVRTPDHWARALSFVVVKSVIHCMQTAAELNIVSSFFRRSLGDDFRLVGPIYRRAVLDARSSTVDDGFVLVYAPPFVDRLLVNGECGRDTEFVLFTEQTYRRLPGNVRRFGIGSDFIDYLRRCRAVITNGGHQTMSEALLLGKPVLCVPQAGQFEEHFNGLHLATSGCGAIASRRKLAGDLEKFLQNLPKYREANAALASDDRFCISDGAGEAVALLRPLLSLTSQATPAGANAP